MSRSKRNTAQPDQIEQQRHALRQQNRRSRRSSLWEARGLALDTPAAIRFRAVRFELLESRLLLDAEALEQDATEIINWQGREVEVVRGEWVASFAGDVSLTMGPPQLDFDIENLVLQPLDSGSDSHLGTTVEGTYGPLPPESGADSPTHYLVRTGDTEPSRVLDWLTAIPGFRYAEPNFTVSMDVVPNDPSFSQLWGLHNANDRDIDAPEAWDKTTGSSSVVVGVIDTGVDYTHVDLAANMWTNPVECPAGSGTCIEDGVDNDANGFIDDFYGWDFVNGDNDPFDDNSHGTHVAGTIAAVGNNGTGVVGVSWNTRIMALKFLGSGGSGTTADAIKAIDYATKMKRDYGVNIRLTNNSWGGGADSQALKDAITASGQQDMLFIAAAGNSAVNTDNSPHYPSSYNLDNIISVASTTDQDALSSFSNTGVVSVDLAAPGSSIYSTLPYGLYGFKSGTSMATPHVAGVAALAWDVAPSSTRTQVRDAILTGVDSLPALLGKTVTGGRLNAQKALDYLGLFVTSTSPAQGDVVAVPPTTFTLNFSQAYTASSIDASDLKVNGISANSVTLLDSDSVRFTFNSSPVSTEGSQTMFLAAGSVTRLSDGDGVAEMSRSFLYDPTPLQVLATTPAAGSTLTLPDPTIVVDFSEAIAAGSVGISDLQLTAGRVVLAKLLDANSVEYTLTDLVAEQPLTVTLNSGAVRDTDGQPNQLFQATFNLDFGTAPYPQDFQQWAPLGSLIYESTLAGIVHNTSDTDSFNLELQAGQTISAALLPSAALAGKVKLLSPTDSVVASASGAAGATITIQTPPAPVSGVYRLVIEGNGSTTGTYNLVLDLNAYLETESYGGSSNGVQGSAQDLSAGWSTLSGASSRLGARGKLSSGSDVDWFQLSLTSSQAVSLALEGVDTSTIAMTLHAANGSQLAAGAAVSNADQFVLNYFPSTTASYFLRISGNTTPYALVAVRGASFDAELNDTRSTAQNLNATLSALGHVGSGATASHGDEADQSDAQGDQNGSLGFTKTSSGLMLPNEWLEDAVAVHEHDDVVEILWDHSRDPRNLFGALDLTEHHLSVNSAPEGDLPSDAVFTNDGQRILIVNRDSGNVIVYDADTRAVEADIAVGEQPVNISLSPDGQYALTANTASDTVSIINLNTLSVAAEVPVSNAWPYRVQVTPDGQYAVVATLGRFVVISMSTFQEVNSFASPDLGAVSISVALSRALTISVTYADFKITPNSQTLVVPDSGFSSNIGKLRLYDLGTGTETAAVTTPGRNIAVAISQDGSTAYVATQPRVNEGMDAVTKIDLVNGSLIQSFPTEALWGNRMLLTPDEQFAIVQGFNRLLFINVADGSTATGFSFHPFDIALSHDGKYLVTATLHVIDVATRTEVAALPSIGGGDKIVASPTEYRATVLQYLFGEDFAVININGDLSATEVVLEAGSSPEGDTPTDIAISPDGLTAVTANYESDNAAIINLATRTVLAWVDTGTRPDDVAITPDGNFALVTSPIDHSLTIIDLVTRTVVKTLSGLTSNPRHVLISPDSSRAYVNTTGASGGLDKVYFIDLDGANSSVIGSLVVGDIANDIVRYTTMALSPDGSVLAVPATRDDELVLIDTVTQTEIARLATGGMPMEAVFSADGSRLYTTDTLPGTVTVINVAGVDSSVEAIIGGLSGAENLVLDEAGDYLYVSTGLQETVVVIDTSTRQIVKTIPLPADYFAGRLEVADNLVYVIGSLGIPLSVPLVGDRASLFRILADGPASALIDQTPLSGWSHKLLFDESLRSVAALVGSADGLDLISYQAEGNGDEDYFRFTPQAGDQLTVTATRPASSLGHAGNELAMAIELFDNAGNSVARGLAGSLSYTVTTPGTFSVRVYALGFTEGEYVLTIDGATQTTRPIVSSIVRGTPTASHTSADQVTFRVTFSEDVVNVGTADFVLSGSAAPDGTISTVSPISASVYDVTISGIVNSNGTINLDIANGNDIQDLQSLALGNSPGVDYEEFYTIDNLAPAATSIVRHNPATSPTNADVLVFRATFSEDVIAVDSGDFAVDGATSAGVSSVVQVSGQIYDVTISGGDLAGFNGIVGLNFSLSQNITDLAGTSLPAGEPTTDETYLLANAHDLGDAPLPYPVTLAELGARHESSGPTLGVNRDSEANATHSAAADADDTTSSPDDEDGVIFGTIREGQLDAIVTVNVQNAPSGAKLDAWIDFDRDGSWGGPFEQIAHSVPLVSGNNSISFEVPAWSLVGTTYGRFRLSTQGNLGVRGLAADGEVEDHPLTISPPLAAPDYFGGPITVGSGTDEDVRAVFTADLDGDGDMDILSSSSSLAENRPVLWHENDGNEVFTRHVLATGAYSVTSLFASDIDGDGDLDALSASQFDDMVAWYENDGGQNFAKHVLTTAADGALKVMAADMDGDSDLDVVAFSQNDTTIAWYENQGSSAFTEHVVTTTATSGETIFTTDLDGDGDIDIVADESQIAWYENNGAGTFTRKVVFARSVSALAASDVDRDGDMDVVSADFATIAWYENDGNQTFTFRSISTAVSQSSSVAVADVDGDGDMDVVSQSTSDTKVVWQENDGNQNFTQQVISPHAESLREIFPSDVDGDGDIDVLAALIIPDKIVWFEHLNGTPPQLVALSPADNAAVVAPDANLVLTFDKSVQKGTGDIIIYQTSNGAVFEAIGITSAQVNIDGAQVTINPTGTLANNQSYNVRLSATALEDTSGNGYYGIHDAATWNFTTLQSGVDYGDAPDTGAGTGSGNYNTLSTDNGPSHAIMAGLFLGRTADADSGALQGNRAQADDVHQAAPDDEDGLNTPATDLLLTIGSQPTVSVIVTNTTGSAATLSGWIDYDHDGVFESAERTQIAVSSGTDRQPLTLTFPSVPVGYFGETYARFRLGTDAAATNPTGASAGGEVEDYTATILVPAFGAASGTSLIAHATGGGPVLVNNDLFGSSVASLGDLDGDGVQDLAMGAPDDNTDSVVSGAVYIALMNANGTVKTLNKITKQTGGPNLSFANRFGSALAPLGDLDGDGIADLAVGSERTGGSAVGAAHILFLNANGTVKSLQTISSNINGGPPQSGLIGFGTALTAIGDLDRDGIVDLAAGARSDNTVGNGRGAVYVILLNANGTAKGFQLITHQTGGGPVLGDFDQFGWSVAALGDLDGDGVPDMAVGATGDDTGLSGAGAVHVLFMNANGTVKSFQKIARQTGGGPTLASGDEFGNSLASVGDMNADGVADLAVGANGDDTGAFGTGAVYVLLMNNNGTAQSFTKIASNTNGGPVLDSSDQFGRSLAPINDLNGDGAIDLAVGAHRDDTGGTDRGAVFVLYLKPQPFVTVTVSPAVADEHSTQNLTYTFHRTGDTSGALTVGFAVTGSAVFNTDYSQTGAATFNATAGTVTFPIGSDSVAVTLDPTSDVSLEPDEIATLTVTAGTGYVMGAPNQGVGTITDDTFVNGVSSPTANGTYKTGDSIDVTVQFSEAVMVTGTPLLEMETGLTDRKATYQSGNGTVTLTFRYIVQPGDVSSDLDYSSTTALTSNGGSILAVAGHNTPLSLPTPGASGSLGNSKSIVIDGAIPTITGDRVWDGGGSSNSWSEAANWSGDLLPQATEQIVFNATSNEHATIDAGFTGSISRLRIDSTYTGIVSLEKSISVGSLFGDAGNVNLNGNTLTTGGDSAHGVYAGVLSGTGALTKVGTGSYYLRANNSYDGPTTITDGSILVSANNALGTAAVGTTVAAGANARLIFERGVNYATPEPVTINGSGFSGVASLAGVGNSTFDGPISLASASTIGAYPAGYTFTLNGAIDTNGNVLTVRGTGSMVLGGIVSDGGGLIKIDANTVTMSGTNTYTGTTTVSGGTLSVTGSIASSAATVNANAILAGSGIVGSVTASGGTVSPGVNFGTMTGSTADFSSGGILRLQVKGYGTPGTDFDRLMLTGSLTLGGSAKLSLDVAGLSGPGTVLAAVSYANVAGTFPTIELVNNQTYGFRACVLNYGATSLNVTIAPPNGACGAGFSSDDEAGAIGELDPLLAPYQSLAKNSSTVIVASLDSGVDYQHPELYQNIWINQDEIPGTTRSRVKDADHDGRITLRDLNHASNRGGKPILEDLNRNGFIDGGDLLLAWSNGKDEDANGYVDDLIGWDFVNNDNNPQDESGHGTHGAGVVIQVAPKSEVMPLKFLDSNLVGTLANASRALDYALAKKATISSNGWVASDFSQEWLDKLTSASASGHLFFTAAGNDDPASLEILGRLKSSQLLVVAATDVDGNLASFSNWDPDIVDLAMPGVGVISTVLGGKYAAHSGTSVATAFAAGLAALIQGSQPGMTRAQLVDAIMGDADETNDSSGDDQEVNPVIALAADLYFAQKNSGTNSLDDEENDPSTLIARLLRKASRSRYK